MKNSSDNNHTGIVSLWCEFYCVLSGHFDVKKILTILIILVWFLFGVSPSVTCQVRSR